MIFRAFYTHFLWLLVLFKILMVTKKVGVRIREQFKSSWPNKGKKCSLRMFYFKYQKLHFLPSTERKRYIWVWYIYKLLIFISVYRGWCFLFKTKVFGLKILTNLLNSAYIKYRYAKLSFIKLLKHWKRYF